MNIAEQLEWLQKEHAKLVERVARIEEAGAGASTREGDGIVKPSAARDSETPVPATLDASGVRNAGSVDPLEQGRCRVTLLRSLIREQAETQRVIEREGDAARARGLDVKTFGGEAWRRIAGWKRELDYLEGCEQLVRQIVGPGISAEELMARFEELEKRRLLNAP